MQNSSSSVKLISITHQREYSKSIQNRNNSIQANLQYHIKHWFLLNIKNMFPINDNPEPAVRLAHNTHYNNFTVDFYDSGGLPKYQGV